MNADGESTAEVLREALQDADGFEADADDLADETDDVLVGVGAVGVGGDAGAFVGLDAVLVNHPFEGAPVAEAVVKCFRKDARERQR